MAVDAAGNVAFDPSANVLDLVAAAIARQDDLRLETGRRIDGELMALQREAALRAEHAKEIRILESDRLDKIRQVDVLAGNTAADRALVAIQTLATSQAAAAETLRAMVSSTASTIATQRAADFSAVNERIAALERSSYEGKGKEALADPQAAALIAEVRSLRESRATGEGKSAGLSQGWAILLAGAALIGTVLGIIGFMGGG